MARILGIVIVLFLRTTCFAQERVELRLIVEDEVGAVIPGARVTLVSREGTTLSAIADAAGEAHLIKLAPGEYTLTVEFAGFTTYLDRDLRLPLAQSPRRIVLRVAPVELETEVTTEAPGVSAEPDQNLSMTVIEGELLETLPDNEEDLREYLQLLAGPAAGGARGGQAGAQIYLDGFSGGRLPPREAIMQIRINQNPFSAEYSDPGAGRIEIFTRPGNEQWRGSVGLGIRNAALDARNAFALERPDLDQRRYTLNLSGPLWRKKLSFFANAESSGLEGSTPVRAETLAGPFLANVPSDNRNRGFFLRGGYLVNKNNTVHLTYTDRWSRVANREFAARFGGRGSGGTGIFTLPERASDSENTSRSFSVSEMWLVNSLLVHETRLRYQNDSSESRAATDGVAINVLDAFYGGGSTCCPLSSRRDEINFQDYLTFTWKKHTVRGGLQFLWQRLRDVSGSNFNGTYTFSSLDQYRRVLAGERLDPGDPSSPLIRPTQFTINRGDPLLRFAQHETSWFIQDDMRVRRGVTLSFGLRHEFQANLPDVVNFAPRAGLAWSPNEKNRTVIRVGAGVFYDRLTSNLWQNTLRFNGVTQQNLVIRNPIYCVPLCPELFGGSSVVETRTSIVRVLDPRLKAPYSINFNGSLERQLPAGFAAALTYNLIRGVHQFRARNINAPLPDGGGRPDPTRGNVFQYESTANSIYHGLMLRVTRRFTGPFTIFGNYNLSWTASDADNAGGLPADSFNLKPEWGRAFTDRRHSVTIGGNVSLPWQFRFNPFFTYVSGAPFNITTGADENRDTVINDRPAGIRRNADLPASLYSLVSNRCLANCNPGETPLWLRDYLQSAYPQGVRAVGPGSINLNLSVSKTFTLGKRAETPAPAAQRGGRQGGGAGNRRGGDESSTRSLTISAQVTNLFNHVNFGQYSGILSSPFFGRANSAGPARQIELSLRLGF